MQMTVKQFVNAVYAAWENDPFLSAVAITDVRCRFYAGTLYFYVKCEDKTTTSVYLEEDGRIIFF